MKRSRFDPDALRTARLEVGISQGELARRIHKSPQTISLFEAGERQPSLNTLLNLKDALGCKISDLVNND